MVEKSINQIKSETFKALIGINLSKSLADDCSNSVSYTHLRAHET